MSRMLRRLGEGVSGRAMIALGVVLAALLVAPLVSNGYVLSVLIIALYYAYAGQAWNVMMGFCGQLSLGHSLYVGVAAYAAAILFVKWNVPPIIGMFAAIVIAMAFGAVIGFLAFRFSVSGVYFSLLTIAFAEFTRIGFDHFTWAGGSGGFFLKVEGRTADLITLRGPPIMFYYVMLALTALAFVFCRMLTQSRVGYYWFAIREDQEAAQALGINVFRYKMLAVVVSSGMTALAGVFFAFYYNNLFPEQIFSMARSIELILGPIIGGLGTLFGPILGAFVLTLLADLVTEVLVLTGYDIPGVKQVFYGLCLAVVVIWLPLGIWPPLKRRLGLETRS